MGLLFLVVLFFADDLLLVAETPEELQCFLDLLQAFCAEIKLQVNVSKTFGVVFNAPKRVVDRMNIVFDGQPISFVEVVKYLGAMFHSQKGIVPSFEYLAGVANRAIHSAHGKCHTARIHLPVAKCKMFDALVMPVCTYACEVWTPILFSDPSPNKCLKNKMEKLHIDYLRGVFHLRKSTSHWMILREFGRLPVFFHWWSKVLKYMKRACKMDDTCVVRHAFLQEMQLVKDGKNCWLAGVLHFLRLLYPSEIPQRIETRLEWIVNLQVAKVRKDLVAVWKSMWGDIASGVIASPKLLFYNTFMASDDTKTKHGWFAPAKHMNVAMANDIHTSLVRFRLGNHNLLCEQRRWLRLPALSVSRFTLCRSCELEVQEDEAHMLLQCPYYEHVRMDDRFTELLSYQSNLRALFSCPFQIILARFIAHMLQCRSESGIMGY